MQAPPDLGYNIKFYVNSVNGIKLGEVKVGHDVDPKSNKITVPIKNVPDEKFNLVVQLEKADAKENQIFVLMSVRPISGK